MRDRIIRLLGGDPEDVMLLIDVFQKERDARLLEKANEGVDLKTLKALVALPLSMIGMAVLYLTYIFRDDPALVGTLVFSTHAAVFLSTVMFDILRGLLGDEDLRVIASWPVKSNTVLLSRLFGSLKSALGLAAFIGAPSSLFACFLVGTPLITGSAQLLILMVFAVALMLMTTALISFTLWLIGIDNLRSFVVFVGLSGMILVGVVGMMLFDGDLTTLKAEDISFASVPFWLPTGWLGTLLSFTTSQPHVSLLGVALAFVILFFLPVISFRITGVAYTRLLLSATTKSIKTRGRLFYKLLTLGSKRHADHVLAQLCVAHARCDWRFRAEAMMIPIVCFMMVFSMNFETSQSLFADPFIHTGYLHPCMFFLVVIMTPPIFALPLLACSTEYKASWALRMGQITPQSYKFAVIRVLRIVFVLPFVITLGLIYLFKGVPLHHILAHLLMLFLLAETMVGVMQGLFGEYPMSLPPEDEDMMLKIMPVFLVLEISGALFSGIIYNVFYRWWWAYLIGIALLVVFRKASLKSNFMAQENETDAAPVEQPVKEKRRSTPLIAAVKDGRLFTAKLLITTGDLNHVDEHGKTAGMWARESGNEELIALFDQHEKESADVPTP